MWFVLYPVSTVAYLIQIICTECSNQCTLYDPKYMHRIPMLKYPILYDNICTKCTTKEPNLIQYICTEYSSKCTKLIQELSGDCNLFDATICAKCR